jgi:hypothetical protein
MEVQVVKASVAVPETGYGMPKSDRPPVPVDFDPAVLQPRIRGTGVSWPREH